MELKDVSIVISGECYQRLINHLTKNFTYLQVYQVIKDLEQDAFQVENHVVAAYDPKLNVKSGIQFPLVNGLEEAREIDQEEIHQEEMHQDEPVVADEPDHTRV